MNKCLIILIITIFTASLGAKELYKSKPIQLRIKGFEEHELEKKKLVEDREKDKDDFLKERKAAKADREKAQNEYILSKKKVKIVKPEDTQGYEEYLLKKWKDRNDPVKVEEAQRYIDTQNENKKNGQLSRFEMREFGLENTEKNRIAFNLRKLFPKPLGGTASGSGSSPGTGSGSSGGSYGGGRNFDSPSFDDNNNFFDNNDIPPPPPPPPPPPGVELNDFGNYQAPSMAPPEEPPPFD